MDYFSVYAFHVFILYVHKPPPRWFPTSIHSALNTITISNSTHMYDYGYESITHLLLHHTCTFLVRSCGIWLSTFAATSPFIFCFCLTSGFSIIPFCICSFCFFFLFLLFSLRVTASWLITFSLIKLSFHGYVNKVNISVKLLFSKHLYHMF